MDILIITLTETGKKIQVFQEDLPQKLTWFQAVEVSGLIGKNWRLPAIEELEAMHEQLHINNIGNFKTDTPYWSSEEEDDNFAWPFDFSYTPIFSDGKDDLFYVRLVKDCI